MDLKRKNPPEDEIISRGVRLLVTWGMQQSIRYKHRA